MQFGISPQRTGKSGKTRGRIYRNDLERSASQAVPLVVKS